MDKNKETKTFSFQHCIYSHKDEDEQLYTISRDFCVQRQSLKDKCLIEENHYSRGRNNNMQNFIECVTFYKNYVILGFEDGQIIQFDFKTCEMIQEIEIFEQQVFKLLIVNEQLVCGCINGDIAIYDFESQVVEKMFKLESKIKDIQFENGYLYTIGNYWILNELDIKNKTIQCYEFECYILCFFILEQQVLLGKDNNTVEIYNITNLSQLKCLIKIYAIPSCLGLFDGFLFVATHKNTILVYDSNRGYMYVETLENHTNTITFLKLIGDNVYSGSLDQRIYIWSIHEIKFKIQQIKFMTNLELDSRKQINYNVFNGPKHKKPKRY